MGTADISQPLAAGGNWAREQFPALRDRVFLDAACVSIMPARAERAVCALTAELTRPTLRDATAHHLWMDRQRATAPPQVARLLGIDEHRVALIESTTHGLNIAAQSIPWQRGDEVLLCDLEFLQVAIPFVKLAETAGVRPVFLHHRNGRVEAADFAAAITPRTRAVVVSSTQWSNGYRIDLATLADACEQAGAWLVVDAIQQAGAVPVETDGIDFLIAGGHKWLNAPMGTGFMALSQRVLEQLDPASWGYLSSLPPADGWDDYFTTPDITPARDYEFVADARRFEIGGTSNYPGAVCLAKSLEVVNALGIAAAGERVWELGERLQEGLRRLDLRLETPFDRDHRAGIIAFHCGSRERDAACVRFLADRDICVAQRYTANTGGVRVSVHYFNNEEDIDRLLAATADFLAGH